MRRFFISLPIAFFFFYNICAQNSGIISGPMLGPVELRDAKIWIEVSPEVRDVVLHYNKKGFTNRVNKIKYSGELGKPFNPIQFTVGGLDFNTAYEYKILVNGKVTSGRGEFITKDLWQWRKPLPDFTFLTGSCSYFNEPVYDRPGKPYGGDSSIYQAMAREKAAFMLWLGDNWYTREVDYYSEWGLWYRAQYDRSRGVLQPFLKSMSHFSTWDDHDYGPNDIGSNYILKQTSRDVFMKYFCNPSYGENGQGIYTMTSYGDVDIFITDDRWWRSAHAMPDSVNGKPNQEKRMFGEQQMTWLKNSLLFSTATFKIIVVGSQVLNPVSPYDKLMKFPFEYYELMNFLLERKITGALFLSGDRHHSEIIKVNREAAYPLYDITVSPLTSSTHQFGSSEKNNPYRVFGLEEKQNYGRITVSGKRGERKLMVEFVGFKGENLGQWSIMENELRKF